MKVVLTFAAATILLLAVAPAMAADVALLDLDRPLDLTMVPVRDATVSRTKVVEGLSLQIVTGHQQNWPGIDLAPPGGRWDLSPYQFVALDVRNTGTNSVRVNCRVDNPNVERGQVNCVTDGLDLEPGKSGTLKVELRRKKGDLVKVELFGMRGYPWGMPVSWVKPGECEIDPSNVVNLVIFVPKPKEDHEFEISNIRATGRFQAPTGLLKDPDRFFPFIDEYGQYMHADWPGKTHSADELRGRRDSDDKELLVHPGPKAWDKYGGWLGGPTMKATGFFTVAKHQGKWWLVDPDGKLFFSHGIDCVTPYEGTTPIDGRARWFRNLPAPDQEFKECYAKAHSVVHGYYQGKQPQCFDFGRANLMRKYGKDWAAEFSDTAHRRLRSWGMNTIANWSSPDTYLMKRTPYTVSIWFGGKQLEGSSGYWGKFRDVFDPSFAAEARKWMGEQKGKTAGDPWCIGYFVDNEISWGEDDVSLAVAALTSPDGQAAKKVLIDELKARYGDIAKLNTAWGAQYDAWESLAKSTTAPDRARAHDDLAAFHAKTCDTYFRTVRTAVKEVAPNQLYLGCRFAWANASAVSAAVKHCDVVSYNLYRHSVSNFRLPVEADVPLIIGEFHFGALDRGLFHTGLVSVEDQAARAQAYKDYVRGVLAHPQFVGCHWFKYMDEPTTGRYYDEENYQIGFVDIVDTPYPETIAASREIGETLYEVRVKAR